MGYSPWGCRESDTTEWLRFIHLPALWSAAALTVVQPPLWLLGRGTHRLGDNPQGLGGSLFRTQDRASAPWTDCFMSGTAEKPQEQALDGSVHVARQSRVEPGRTLAGGQVRGAEPVGELLQCQDSALLPSCLPPSPPCPQGLLLMGVSCQGAQSSGPPGLPPSLPTPPHGSHLLQKDSHRRGRGFRVPPLPGQPLQHSHLQPQQLGWVHVLQTVYLKLSVAWIQAGVPTESAGRGAPRILRVLQGWNLSTALQTVSSLFSKLVEFSPILSQECVIRGWTRASPPLSPQHPVSRHLWVRVSVSPLPLLLQHHSPRVLMSSALKGRLPG